MTIAQLRSALDESRAQLFATIRGLSEEQFRHAPRGDGWNIAAHLAHLLRNERLWVPRAQRALHEDEPLVQSTGVDNDDDPALAARMAVPQIIHGMQASRRDLLRVLDAAGEGGLERSFTHERRGRMTVRDIAVKMHQHEIEHGEQVAALAREASSASPVIIPLKPRS